MVCLTRVALRNAPDATPPSDGREIKASHAPGNVRWWRFSDRARGPTSVRMRRKAGVGRPRGIYRFMTQSMIWNLPGPGATDAPDRLEDAGLGKGIRRASPRHRRNIKTAAAIP